MPSGPVITVAATAAPLSAETLTVCPASALPNASVTFTRSVFAIAPSATEPSLMTTRSAICAVLTSATNVTFRLRLLLLMLAVTVLAPAVWLVTLISTVPSGSVITVGAVVAPLSANTLTVCPASALPNASVTLARSIFAIAPSATELSRVTTRSAICAVLTSAINVTVRLRLLLLMLAVTVLVPAVWLVTLISTVPSCPVMTVGATVAPLPANTLTVCPASTLPLASVTFTRSVFAIAPSATELSCVTSRLAICAVLTSAINVTFRLWLLLLMLAVTALVPAVWLVAEISTVPSSPVMTVGATVAPLSANTLTACPASAFPNASVTLTCSVFAVAPSATALSWLTTRSAICAVLTSAINVTFRLWLLLLTLAVTALIPAVWLVTEISAVPSGCVVTVGAVVAPLPANTLTVCPASAFPNASVTFTRSVFAVEPSATELSRVTTRSAICAVLTSAINVTVRLWLLLLMLAVTALIPAVWLVTLISTVPSGCVVTVGAVVAPLPANTLTVCPASAFPLASVTFTRSVFAVEPSATELSRVTTRSAICAVLTSATNVTFRLWLLLLMLAVTALIPAVWLVTEISAVPSGCVVTVGAVVALLPANTLTVCPASTLPNASVTLTRSVFAIAPSATALSCVTSRLAICAVLTSAINVTFRLWLLLLMLAVTALIPAVWLVTEISAVPSGCVVTVGVTVALLSAVTLTVCPASTLPNASVTLTRSVFAIAPSATELSRVTTRSAICAVLTSAINVTSRLWLLLLMVAVTALVPAVWLVTLISTVPSGSVITVGATVAPLSANTLTVCPPSALPNTSVTFTHSMFSVAPSATALSCVTPRSAIRAVLTSATKFTVLLSLL